MDKKPDYKERKVIVVDSCETCPFYGQCKPWRSLSPKERVTLTIGTSVQKFILKGCPLPDGPDRAAAFGSIENEQETVNCE